MLTKEGAEGKLKNHLFYDRDYVKAIETVVDLYNKLEKAEADNASRLAEGFAKGQESVKRKNQSGCTCIITDDEQIESVCGFHADWRDEQIVAALRRLVEGK